MPIQLDNNNLTTYNTLQGDRRSFTGDQRKDAYINKQLLTGKWGYDEKTGGLSRLEAPLKTSKKVNNSAPTYEAKVDTNSEVDTAQAGAHERAAHYSSLNPEELFRANNPDAFKEATVSNLTPEMEGGFRGNLANLSSFMTSGGAPTDFAAEMTGIPSASRVFGDPDRGQSGAITSMGNTIADDPNKAFHPSTYAPLLDFAPVVVGGAMGAKVIGSKVAEGTMDFLSKHKGRIDALEGKHFPRKMRGDEVIEGGLGKALGLSKNPITDHIPERLSTANRSHFYDATGKLRAYPGFIAKYGKDLQQGIGPNKWAQTEGKVKRADPNTLRTDVSRGTTGKDLMLQSRLKGYSDIPIPSRHIKSGKLMDNTATEPLTHREKVLGNAYGKGYDHTFNTISHGGIPYNDPYNPKFYKNILPEVEALAHKGVLEKASSAYRGILSDFKVKDVWDANGNKIPGGSMHGELSPGMTYEGDQITSVTSDVNSMDQFSSSVVENSRMKIHLPKGQKLFNMNANSHSPLPSEMESLLPKNTRFKVLSQRSAGTKKSRKAMWDEVADDTYSDASGLQKISEDVIYDPMEGVYYNKPPSFQAGGSKPTTEEITEFFSNQAKFQKQQTKFLDKQIDRSFLGMEVEALPQHKNGGKIMKYKKGGWFQSTKAGRGVRDVARLTVNSTLNPIEGLVGTDFGFDEKYGYSNDWAKTVGKVTEGIGTAVGGAANAYVNTIVPGSGAALNVVGSGLENSGVTQAQEGPGAVGKQVGQAAGMFMGGEPPMSAKNGMQMQKYGVDNKADLEAEGGELVLTQGGAPNATNSNASMSKLGEGAYKINGNSHGNGGVDMEMPNGKSIIINKKDAPTAQKYIKQLEAARKDADSGDHITKATGDLNVIKASKALDGIVTAQQARNGNKSNVMRSEEGSTFNKYRGISPEGVSSSQYGLGFDPQEIDGNQAGAYSNMDRSVSLPSYGGENNGNREYMGRTEHPVEDRKFNRNSQYGNGGRYMKAVDGLEFYGNGTQDNEINLSNFSGQNSYGQDNEDFEQDPSTQTAPKRGGRFDKLSSMFKGKGMSDFTPYASSAYNIGMGVAGLINPAEGLDATDYTTDRRTAPKKMDPYAHIASASQMSATYLNNETDPARRQAYASEMAPKVAKAFSEVDYFNAQNQDKTNAANVEIDRDNNKVKLGIRGYNDKLAAAPYEFLKEGFGQAADTSLAIEGNNTLRDMSKTSNYDMGEYMEGMSPTDRVEFGKLLEKYS